MLDPEVGDWFAVTLASTGRVIRVGKVTKKSYSRLLPMWLYWLDGDEERWRPFYHTTPDPYLVCRKASQEDLLAYTRYLRHKQWLGPNQYQWSIYPTTPEYNGTQGTRESDQVTPETKER